MGGSESTNVQEEEQMLSNFQLMSTEEDRRFGDVSIYRNKKSGRFVWVKEIPTEDETASEHYKKYIREKAYENDMFITISCRVSGGARHMCTACSATNKLMVVMDYYERDLEGEIMRRTEDVVRAFLTFWLYFYRVGLFS